MDQVVTKSFAVRCKEYFGMLSGETLSEFSQELRKLTPQDKADLIAEFDKLGMPVTKL